MIKAIVSLAVVLAVASAVSAIESNLHGCGEFVFAINATGDLYRLNFGRQNIGIKFNEDKTYETLSPSAPELTKMVGTTINVHDLSWEITVDGDLELPNPKSGYLKDDSVGIRGQGWVAHFRAHHPEYVFAIILENKLAFVIDHECKLQNTPVTELDRDIFAELFAIQQETANYRLLKINWPTDQAASN